MIVNLIGDCDKRPIIYTLMKIFQTLGDVLFVTNNSYFRRLSDTGESGGHYQNTMIAFTNGGIGDFFEDFRYDYADFTHVILDSVPEPVADLTIHVCSMVDSEETKDMLEYMDDVQLISLWENKGVSAAYLACEKFEAFKYMTPMPSTIVQSVAVLLAEPLKASVDNLLKIGLAVPHGAEQLKPQHRQVGMSGGSKRSKMHFSMKGGR